jgi:hypothetical protein
MTVEPLAALPPRDFEICPICRAAPPTTEEDLPPNSLGGSVMTRTCQRCNSGLGTRLERDLSHWFHNVLPDARFTSPGIRGARRAGEVVVMTTAANTATLVMKGGHDPDVDNWLETALTLTSIVGFLVGLFLALVSVTLSFVQTNATQGRRNLRLGVAGLVLIVISLALVPIWFRLSP